MVTRADLPAYLCSPVLHIPLEPARRDPLRPGQGDDAHILFEEMPAFTTDMVGAVIPRPVRPRRANHIPPRTQDECDTLLRNEIEMSARPALILRLRHEIEMMDLRESLVDAAAETAQNKDIYARLCTASSSSSRS